MTDRRQPVVDFHRLSLAFSVALLVVPERFVKELAEVKMDSLIVLSPHSAEIRVPVLKRFEHAVALGRSDTLDLLIYYVFVLELDASCWSFSLYFIKELLRKKVRKCIKYLPCSMCGRW